MTDEERAELFSALDREVRAAGLGWVADEVSALIDQGVELEVPAEEWSGRGKPKRNELRITRREYTPIERIELLIDATTRVLSQALAVEAAVLQHFRPSTVDGDGDGDGEPRVPMDVNFRSEPRVGDADARDFILGSAGELAERATAIAELTSELERVRSQAAAG